MLTLTLMRTSCKRPWGSTLKYAHSSNAIDDFAKTSFVCKETVSFCRRMGVRDESIVYFDGVLKILGVSHGVLGGLLIVLGVVVRLTVDHWTSIMLLGLWIGVITAATGAIAVIDSDMEKADNSKKYYLTDFLLFSVLSLLLSFLLLVCYSMAVHTAFTGDEVGSFSWYSYEKYKDQNMSRAKSFSVIILIVGCLEFLLCCGSIGYVAHAYKRDQKRKQRPQAADSPYSQVNESYNR